MRSIESNKKDFGIYWSESFSIDDYVYGNIKIRIIPYVQYFLI